MPSHRVLLSAFAILVVISAVAAVPIPEDDVEDSESADGPEPRIPVTRSPPIPKISEKDLHVPEEEDYDEDPDYLTWEDLGRMIYSWAKLFAEPKQLKHMRKCLVGNAPRDAAELIKRVETCVRIVDPEFSLWKIANLLIGS